MHPCRSQRSPLLWSSSPSRCPFWSRQWGHAPSVLSHLCSGLSPRPLTLRWARFPGGLGNVHASDNLRLHVSSLRRQLCSLNLQERFPLRCPGWCKVAQEAASMYYQGIGHGREPDRDVLSGAQRKRETEITLSAASPSLSS